MDNFDKYNNQIVTKNIIEKIELKYLSDINISSYNLMERAGKTFANFIIKNIKKNNILFLCGKGGNGGDGLIAARILKKEGWKVTVVLVNKENELSKDTSKAYKKLKITTKNFKELKLEKFKIIIDAIFGLGISRNISGVQKSIIKTINSLPVTIISIDIPSGINSDNGKIMGTATKCTYTATFSRKKIGNILLPGYSYNGKLKTLDIGIPNSYFNNEAKPKLYTNQLNLWKKTITKPKIDDHKYSRGCTLIIGGPRTMTGAARLAAKAAQRTGSGIVLVAVDKKSEDIYYSSLTSQVIKSYSNLSQLELILDDTRIDSIVVGPGLGIGIKTINLLKLIFKKERKIILDADAISCFEKKFNLLKKLIAGSDVIFTPHKGELIRLFPNLNGTDIENSYHAANKLSSTVVLKGPNSIISNQKLILANMPGTKWLATAGSGDVLSGIIGGLLSNGINPISAAGLGVFIHTEAGKIIGPGLTAEDLIDAIPVVLKNILKL